MAPTELITAAGAAVLVPTFAGPWLSKLPGGNFGAAAAAAVLIYGGSKMEGLPKSILVGAGAGVLVGVLANLFIRPGATVSA